VSIVGFNPFRARVNRRSDILFVGAAIVVVLVLLLWALLG
jgi:hypothetical protein